jgi:hypothetical protein
MMHVPFKYQSESEGANEYEDKTMQQLKDLGLFLNCALQFGEPWKPMVSLTVLSSFS